MCVNRDGKVMYILSNFNYNTEQTFQEVLTVARETLIPCFGMFGKANIGVSITVCVFLPAVFWHQLAQRMVTTMVWQNGSRLIGPLYLTITTTIKAQVSKTHFRI